MPRYKLKDGVIITAESNKFICLICVAPIHKRKDKIVHLQKHLETEIHIDTLKKYKENFSDNIDGIIKCKTCNRELIAEEFFSHAKSHRLYPWYYYTRTTHYLRNFILYIDNCFYCYLCKETFNYSHEVNKHNKSQEHTDIVKKKFPKLKYNLYDSRNIPVSFYHNNNVFPVNEKYCWCWICDVDILTSEISQHSKKHVSNIDQQKSESILSCKSDKQDETVDGDHDDVYDDDKQSLQVSEKLKYSTKYTGPFPFTCGICDIRFSTLEQVQIHCNGLSHNDQLEKLENKLNTLQDLDDLDLPIGIKVNYLDDDDESVVFECTLCKLKMFTITKLLKHIDCIEHFKRLTNIYTETGCLKNTKLPVGILSTTISDIFYCRPCHVTIRGFDKISCHIQDAEHAKLILKRQVSGPRPIKKQYLSEEYLKIAESTNEYPPEIKFISEKNNICVKSFWWCMVCSCILIQPSSLDMSIDMKIWTHIVGTNHVKNKKTFYKNNCDIKKEEQDKTGVDDIVISLPLDDLYDVQMNDNEKSSTTCKPCKFHIYGDIYDIIPDWNHHLSTKNHQQKELEYTKKTYESSEYLL
ncbi:uncharacterized protein LOC122850977 [Aphidius gifuensis]|uniref:uncharacterized protein LOC122850977 n=1 Tax=Aphidius gifuensis TaxID=684658 RepID=UPI001CDB5CB5|nr:uncharacterized protein LOC122850977 [Aphidius gifuensis]